MAKKKRKARPSTEDRKHSIIVYGRFESRTGTYLETWTGKYRSMAVAMRQAILDLWARPAVHWKHHRRVSITAQEED
jgi:hypothetical protein